MTTYDEFKKFKRFLTMEECIKEGVKDGPKDYDALKKYVMEDVDWSGHLIGMARGDSEIYGKMKDTLERLLDSGELEVRKDKDGSVYYGMKQIEPYKINWNEKYKTGNGEER